MARNFMKATLSAAVAVLTLVNGATQVSAKDLANENNPFGFVDGDGKPLSTEQAVCIMDPNYCFFRQINKKHMTSKTDSNPHRQKYTEFQQALRTFGFRQVPIDDLYGPKSRAAISDYQYYIGHPSTGELTGPEHRLLDEAMQQYRIGNSFLYPNMMAAEGPRGLLRTLQDPSYPVRFGDHSANALLPPFPLSETQSSGSPQVLPTALDCEQVEKATSSHGRAARANMADPAEAGRFLSEKFCEARYHAMRLGEHRASEYLLRDADLQAICGHVGDAYHKTVEVLPLISAVDVIDQSKLTMRQLGVDQHSAKIYGEICLGEGYQWDDPGMALGGALLLLAAGKDAYGEIVAHHLYKGFGTRQNSTAAALWYHHAVSALENGAVPAFNPAATRDRIALFRALLSSTTVLAKPTEHPIAEAAGGPGP